ncbi:MAG: hypothetical protein ACRDVD_03335 [Acidimicrobiia bacterium]
MDIRDRLTAHHKTEIANTRQPDLGAVMERGDELKTRRRLLVVALPVAAAALVVVGVMSLRPEAAQVEGNDADEVAAANAVLSISSAALDWESSPAQLGQVMQSAVSSDGIMYALSTAPGVRWEQFPNGNLPEAIYASSDGVSWTSHPTNGNWINSIAASSGLLYAVGTAPGAQADSVTLQVGTSSDLGATFTTTALPFEVGGRGSTDTRILANSDAVLAVATQTVSLDPWSLIPPEVLEGSDLLVLQDRVAVFPLAVIEEANQTCFSEDAAACEAIIEAEATYTATWEELGVEVPEMAPGSITGTTLGTETATTVIGAGGGVFPDEGMFFGDRVTNAAFISTGGSTFEEIEYPLPEGWIDRVVKLGDTNVVSVSGPAGASLLASEDLVSWQPIAPELDGSWILDIGQMGEVFVLVGVSPQGDKPVVYRADDLYGSWTEVPVGDLLPTVDNQQSFLWVNSAAVGSGGVAISLGGEFGSAGNNPIMDLIGRVLPGGSEDDVEAGMTEQASFVLVSRDLAEWSAATSAEMGGFVETLQFSPQGDLIATVADFENGQPQRLTAKATITP